MRIVRVVCWLALVAGAVFAGLNGAGAQGTAQEQQACTPDAMRLCADAIPDVTKVTACMKAKYSQLSEPCRVAMRGGGAHTTRQATHYYRHTRAPRCDPYTHLCS
jgi:hypothetical protein